MMSKVFEIFACFSLLFLQMEFGNGGKHFSSWDSFENQVRYEERNSVMI